MSGMSLWEESLNQTKNMMEGSYLMICEYIRMRPTKMWYLKHI